MKFCAGTAFLRSAECVEVATLLDDAGYYGAVCSDHLFYPRRLDSPYPSPTGKPMWAPETAWPDSWVLIGAMAAVTTNLRFTNAVYVAPARPLLEVVKQIATAAVISENRVSLAVGAGWMREEFDVMGQQFDNRGRRLDEMIPALRALWQGGWVSWAGEHYTMPEMMIEPHPSAAVPIMCGGDSEAALRRAARLCDGWVGASYTLEQATDYVARLRRLLREYGRSGDPFEIIVGISEPPSADVYLRARDIGVSGVMCAPWAGVGDVQAGALDAFAFNAERYRAPIERFAEEVIAKIA